VFIITARIAHAKPLLLSLTLRAQDVDFDRTSQFVCALGGSNRQNQVHIDASLLCSRLWCAGRALHRTASFRCCMPASNRSVLDAARSWLILPGSRVRLW
jgi:hypothetical protein